MKADSVFYKNLRKYIGDNVTVSELCKEPLFKQNHCKKTDKINDNAFIYHRCKQWLSDLRCEKRPPKLTIQDLETIYNLKKVPLGSILEPSSYWTEKIEYVDDEFIKVLHIIQNKQEYNDLLKDLVFPICYDPKSSTSLFAIAIVEKNHNILNQISKTENLIKPIYSLRFVVIDALDCARLMTSKETSIFNGNINDCFTNYISARGHFKTVCSLEKDLSGTDGLGHSIDKFTHYFTECFFEEPDGGIAAILNKQKLFYGYFSNCLSEKIKNKKPRFINLFNRINELKNNFDYERGITRARY